MMNTLRANGPRGKGKKMHKTRITLRHVLYLSGYFSGISVELIPMAQNSEAKVDPSMKIDKVVIEYSKFLKIAGSVSLKPRCSCIWKT
jgi:hypothetical protein